MLHIPSTEFRDLVIITNRITVKDFDHIFVCVRNPRKEALNIKVICEEFVLPYVLTCEAKLLGNGLTDIVTDLKKVADRFNLNLVCQQSNTKILIEANKVKLEVV